jgi:hypothetical protein
MLSIPIIAEYNGKALDRAVKDFKQLETAGEKAHFLIKKAAVPAAAALAGVTTALTLAVKAAMDDEAEQAILAKTLQNVTGASDKQVKATEDMIAAMSRATGTADSDLRPALAVLVTGTKDVATATDTLRLAQDIAAGSGKSLSDVSDALAKAYGGNMKGLQALSPEIRDMIKKGESLDDVMKVLSETFGGQAATAAETAAGKFKIFKNSIGETKEAIGAALLPAVEAVLPYLQKFADWANKNPDAFLVIAGTIAAVAAAIVAVNIAMAANPFTLVATGIAIAVTAIALAYTQFEGFRNVVKVVFDGIMTGMETFINAFNTILNSIIYAYNLVNFGDDIPSLSTNVNLPRLGGGPVYSGTSERPGMPSTGSVGSTMPSLTPAFVPSSGGSGAGTGSIFGGGGGGGTSGVSGPNQDNFQSVFAGVDPNIFINIDAGLVSTPAQMGQLIIEAIQKAERQSGQVFASA